ncbi:MAG: hypothetical protein GY866_43075 [Proteobacteria bacterium]|nr:hypothetical protein [Pseudomonadota bacterium]
MIEERELFSIRKRVGSRLSISEFPPNWPGHPLLATQENIRQAAAEYAKSTVAPDYVPGKVFKAMEYFDLAIEGARENEYLNEETLAYEVAGRFYLDWGKKIIAQ